MPVDANASARVLKRAWEHPASALPDGWTRREHGAGAVVTLTQLAGQRLPHCLQVRPACDATLAELASERGMARVENIPLMVLDDPRELPEDACRELVVRLVRPEDAQQHASVAGAGFEDAEEHLRALVVPDMLSLPGVRCYVGELNGEPVTTASPATAPSGSSTSRLRPPGAAVATALR